MYTAHPYVPLLWPLCMWNYLTGWSWLFLLAHFQTCSGKTASVIGRCTLLAVGVRNEEVWVYGQTVARALLLLPGMSAANQQQEFHPTWPACDLHQVLRGPVCTTLQQVLRSEFIHFARRHLKLTFVTSSSLCVSKHIWFNICFTSISTFSL